MEKELYQMTDVQADEMLEQVMDLRSEKGRFETIAAGKIGIIQEDLLHKTEKLDNQIQFMKDQLRAFFLTVDRKQTKTQESYSLLSGRLILKKSTQKIYHDDAKLLEWAEQNGQHYIDTKQVSKLNWTEFKKDLSISNGMIVNKVTQEVLEGIGLTIEDVPESFDIK